ncbi:oligoribonuclease [Paramicrobacterium agarici]|uniref:Oligoribonuclease n=2 Tax=Paramicrobacterium agarici TaxID=630514 RepID=A0A2A9DZT4_9MICO|nr:oligoribonuclease [Microbacterium agarici]TQO21370.1 oligoribonuclease [Microbacterium agarici]
MERMSNLSDHLVWIDCEMTGLDVSVDELVEVAVVITDFDLNIVDDGLDIVIKPGASALENMNEFVTEMHRTSGLLEELSNGVSLADAEQRVLDYVKSHIPDERKAPLAGNTIGTDRAFLARYMPQLDAHLHYRNVDVSSVKELSRRWFPRAYFNAPKKEGGHRALADILESIRELQYYRKIVFVPEPGPTSDEAKAAAESVLSQTTQNV